MEDGTHVIIDASKNHYMHPDVEEIFDDFAQNAKTRDITFEVEGRREQQSTNSQRKLEEVVHKKTRKPGAVANMFLNL